MKQYPISFHSALIACIVSLMVFFAAQTAQANVLQRLVEAAIKHDDQLQLAKARLDEAQGQAQQSFGRMFPQISIDSSLAQTYISGCKTPACEDSTTIRNSLNLNQPIFQPEFRRDYKANKARAEQMGYEYGRAYLNLFERLLDQYLNILTVSDKVRTLQAQIKALSEQVKRLESRAEAGSGSTIDLNQARADLHLAEAGLVQSRIQLRTFYAGLSESTKLPLKNLPPIRQELRLPPLEPDDPSHWQWIALEKNLSLLAARKALEANNENRKQSSSKRLPSLRFSSSFTSRNQDFREGGATSSTQTEVALLLSIPLYSGSSTLSEVKQARARAVQTQQQLDLLELETKIAVPSLVRLINRGEDFIAAAHQAMTAARASVTQTEVRYAAGTDSITDVLNAYARSTQAEQNYYASLYDHIRNYIDFYIRTNQLDEERLKRFYALADLKDFDADANPLLEADE